MVSSRTFRLIFGNDFAVSYWGSDLVGLYSSNRLFEGQPSQCRALYTSFNKWKSLRWCMGNHPTLITKKERLEKMKGNSVRQLSCHIFSVHILSLSQSKWCQYSMIYLLLIQLFFHFSFWFKMKRGSSNILNLEWNKRKKITRKALPAISYKVIPDIRRSSNY